MNKNFKNGQLL